MLDREKILSAAGGECGKIEVFDTIDSTSSYLKELARDGAPEHTAVVAASQSGGRGRMGRSFFSPEGTGIYLSLLFRPKGDAASVGMMTAAAAVGVCRALESLGSPELGIKWVNDLYLNGKKVCGILAESVFDSSRGGFEGVVIGVGVNLFEPRGGFPSEIENIAGSVFGNCRQGLAEAAAGGIIRELISVMREGDFLSHYRRRQILIGRSALLLRGGTSERIEVLGLEDDCSLQVRHEDGREEKVLSGEISLKIL